MNDGDCHQGRCAANGRYIAAEVGAEHHGPPQGGIAGDIQAGQDLGQHGCQGDIVGHGTENRRSDQQGGRARGAVTLTDHPGNSFANERQHLGVFHDVDDHE